MIPVEEQQEPKDFDKKVRRKGYKWLEQQGISLTSIPSDPSKLPPLWRECNKQLWDAYGGVCAYLAFRFEYVSGASTTDHFIAKSRHAGQAYEWNNYRLACMSVNRQKGKFDDVIDPFTLPVHTFFLVLESGEIYVNPDLQTQDKKTSALADKTIHRLKLDHPHNREMRANCYTFYIAMKESLSITDTFLSWFEKQNPFVYGEIKRQNKL